MKNLYFLLLLIPLASCEMQPTTPDPAEARQQAFTQFSSYFDALPIDSSDKLACSSLTPTGKQLSDSLMQVVFTENLLKKANFIREVEGSDSTTQMVFDSDKKYSAIGWFGFAADLDAYLVNAYTDDNQHSNHLFLYDRTAKDFTHVQSLNYKFAGGHFESDREAWLYDLNADQVRDIVFLLNMSYQSEEDSLNNFAITDSIRAEAWDGSNFTQYWIEDEEMMKADFGVGEEEASDAL